MGASDTQGRSEGDRDVERRTRLAIEGGAVIEWEDGQSIALTLAGARRVADGFARIETRAHGIIRI